MVLVLAWGRVRSRRMSPVVGGDDHGHGRGSLGEGVVRDLEEASCREEREGRRAWLDCGSDSGRLRRRRGGFQILKGLRERYELHHKLRYTDEALVAAAQLSYQYIR